MYIPVGTAAVIQVDDVTSLSADGKSTAQKVRLLFSLAGIYVILVTITTTKT